MSLSVVAAYYYFYSEQPASEGGKPTLIFGRIIFHTFNPDTAPLKHIYGRYFHKWSKTVRSFYENTLTENREVGQSAYWGNQSHPDDMLV